jgi:ligand-binding sensor domain-containing protein/serine phosphatase RsbU (regulator of sigma subunit)
LKNNILAILLFFAFLSNNTAQNLVFRHLTSDNGLSTIMVNCVYQDSKGFMWFGTQDGLNRYDGYHFKIYKNEPNNNSTLSYSEINSILEVNNQLLVGTPNGLNFLNLTNDSVQRLSFNLKKYNSSENYVNVIRRMNDQEILLGTKNGLIVCDLDTKQFKWYGFNYSEDVAVNDILIYKDFAFVTTDNIGLWKFTFKTKKLEKIAIVDELNLFKNAKGKDQLGKMNLYANMLYVSAWGSGIFKIDPNTFEVEKQIKFKEINHERNYINDFFVKANIAYCATEDGLVTYNVLSEDTSIYVKNTSDITSLNDNKIKSVFQDKSENLWLGTFVGGVNVSFKSSQKFVNSSRYKLNRFKNLFLTFVDKQGNTWISGDRSLRMLPRNSNEYRNYTHISGEIDVLSILQENNDVYWYGTYGDGLRRYDMAKNKITTYLSKEKYTILSIVKLDDYILIASFGDGLVKLNLSDNSMRLYNDADGLKNLNLTNIFIDKNKIIWLLTDGGGVFKVEDFKKSGGKLNILEHLTAKVNNKTIPSDVVYSMNQDNNGNYWFGTINGLSRFDGKTYKNFYESDGLANTFIYSILKDSVGRFWMSTNKGITAFNPTESNKPFFRNYNLKDGLINTEHNIGAASVSELGNVLFGGPNGFNIFRPSLIKDNLKVPPVHVISFKRSGKDIALDSNLIYKKELKLSWRENYFQLEVVALDYIDPEKNLFKYKLEGYDADWSEPSNIRFISYTELPGGTYTLKIKASNSDGVWNENMYELKIIVVPPFWRTTWFYIVLIITGTTGVVLFTQFRTRQIKKENKILENKVAERTKELAEKNRDITSSIQYAKRIQEAILPSKDFIFSRLKRAFILYKPKDIVSGDFYWFGEKNGYKIFAVVDCTGHGVPGAFMSMIGHNLMHQIIQEKGITDPGEVLNNLHKGVQESLRQGNNEINTNDGMDISIIAINDQEKKYLWAGANRPLVLVFDDGEFLKVDGNKYPIGGAQMGIKREFTTKELSITKPAMAYLSSDGYADQFGGENGKKFMVRRYHDLLMEIHLKDMNMQRDLLNENFETWRNEHEQIDDVLVVGVAL